LDGARPLVSVVVASMTGGQALLDCVDSFKRQGPSSKLEIVVAECGTADLPDQVSTEDPQVRFLQFRERRSIPELRGAGLLAARGRILAMTEDHCLAGEGWLAAVIEAHQAADAAIGGAVENLATERAIDWAVYFCEYGRYMLPFVQGPSDDLPGPNVTYKREALGEFEDLLRAGTWEPLWHWRLKTRGLVLSRDPRLIVYHRKQFTFGGFIGERYHYARSFAGQRFAGALWFRRWLFAAGTPLLPALVLCRMALQIIPKGRHVWELLRALPCIVAFTVAWAVGEGVGYVFGSGQSAARIE
jgi:glycosyltransferase involved in cell wall biosynthesis